MIDATLKQPEYYPLMIQGEGGKPLVTIKADGTLIYGEGYNPDEAAQIFWKAMAHYFPSRTSPEETATAPDGYAVVIDDKASAPAGYWFTGCYVTKGTADAVRDSTKSSRVVPIRFLCPPQQSEQPKEKS